MEAVGVGSGPTVTSFSLAVILCGRYFCEKWVHSETTYVILHGLFGGVEFLVVGAATWLMN